MTSTYSNGPLTSPVENVFPSGELEVRGDDEDGPLPQSWGARTADVLRDEIVRLATIEFRVSTGRVGHGTTAWSSPQPSIDSSKIPPSWSQRRIGLGTA